MSPNQEIELQCSTDEVEDFKRCHGIRLTRHVCCDKDFKLLFGYLAEECNLRWTTTV
jgi:hypothetical protein